MAQGRVVVEDPYIGMKPVIFKYSEQEELLSKMPFINTVAYLEQIYGDGSHDSTLLMSYNPSLSNRLMESTKSSVPPVLQVQLFEVHRVLDTVRNTVLNWSLKLEEDGILGDGMAFSKEEKEAATGVSHNINNFYGNVTNSQVQQSSPHASQSQENSSIDIKSLIKFVEIMNECLSTTDLDPVGLEVLKSDLDTISAQAKSPKPKYPIIKESLLSIRSILEGAVGGAVLQYLPQITIFLAALNV